MLCIVRFARLPASAVRLASSKPAERPHASWGFPAPQGGSGPEHARREALPAVEPLMACVMCDIIPTQAKLNSSPFVGSLSFSRLQCTYATPSAGLGFSSAFPVLCSLIWDCKSLLSGQGVGINNSVCLSEAWVLRSSRRAIRSHISLAKTLPDPGR